MWTSTSKFSVQIWVLLWWVFLYEGNIKEQIWIIDLLFMSETYINGYKAEILDIISLLAILCATYLKVNI